MTDMFVQVTVMGQLTCSLVDNNTEHTTVEISRATVN